MAIDSFFKSLGKGDQGDGQDQIARLDLGSLAPNPFQPRKQFDPVQMEELSRSIAEIGVIQPIVVRQKGDIYEIVAGERRWRAAQAAGLASIPAVIRQFSDREMAQIALVENLQRADLSYFEEAEGYRVLIEDFQMTQEDIAKRVGKSQPTIANKLRVLHIHPDVKAQILVELVTERHIRALLKLKTPEEQLLILKQIYEEEMTVKQTEQLIADYQAGRAVLEDEPDAADGEEAEKDSAAPRRQTIRRIFTDMRIYVNTIKATVSRIVESGVPAQMREEETEDGVIVTITIPREKR